MLTSILIGSNLYLINIIQAETMNVSKVNTTKARVYDVTYTYDGVMTIVKVTVKDKGNNGEGSNNKKDDQKYSINKSKKNELPQTGTEEESILVTLLGGLSMISSLVLFLGKNKF